MYSSALNTLYNKYYPLINQTASLSGWFFRTNLFMELGITQQDEVWFFLRMPLLTLVSLASAAVSIGSWSLRGETLCWSGWAAAGSRAWPGWRRSSAPWRSFRSRWRKDTASLISRFTPFISRTKAKHACRLASIALNRTESPLKPLAICPIKYSL